MIEATDFEGRTPFLLAWELGLLEVISKLVDNGSNINALDFEGNSALHLAVINVHIDTVKYLNNTLMLVVDIKNSEN